VIGLALAGVTAATLVAGPGRAQQAAPAPATVTPAHAWPPNPVQLGARLLRHITNP